MAGGSRGGGGGKKTSTARCRDDFLSVSFHLALKPTLPCSTLWPFVIFHSFAGEVRGHRFAKPAPVSPRALASWSPQPQEEAPHSSTSREPLAGLRRGTATEFLIMEMLRTNPLDFQPVFPVLLPKDWKSSFRTCHSSNINIYDALRTMHMLRTEIAYVSAHPYRGSLGSSGSL